MHLPGLLLASASTTIWKSGCNSGRTSIMKTTNIQITVTSRVAGPRPIEEQSPAERAARAAGWDEGEGNIYNTAEYESWKAAVSWSGEDGHDSPVYGSWEECCDMEGIEYEQTPGMKPF